MNITLETLDEKLSAALTELVEVRAALAELLVRVSGPVPIKADAPSDGRAETVAFTDRMLGGPAQPTPERDSALAREDAEHQARYWPGQVDVTSLSEGDAAFFANMAEPFFAKTGKDIRFAGVVRGTTPQINAFRSWGEAWRNNHEPSQYVGPLRAVIKTIMKG